jgi:hypothetical protein
MLRRGPEPESTADSPGLEYHGDEGSQPPRDFAESALKTSAKSSCVVTGLPPP